MVPVAVMRPPSRAYCMAGYDINYRWAVEQHLAVQEVYRRHGYDVHILPPSTKWAASVFTQDNAFIDGDEAILLNSVSWWREKEARHRGQLEKVLSHYLDVVGTLSLPDRLDGGDFVKTDKETLVGIGLQTCRNAVDQIRERMHLTRPIRTVNVKGIVNIHMGSEMSYIGDGALLVTENFTDVAPCQRYDTWEVPRKEEESANCVLLHDGTILMPDFCPGMEVWFRDRGHDVEIVDISEFLKGDGHMSCLSLNFSV